MPYPNIDPDNNDMHHPRHDDLPSVSFVQVLMERINLEHTARGTTNPPAAATETIENTTFATRQPA